MLATQGGQVQSANGILTREILLFILYMTPMSDQQPSLVAEHLRNFRVDMTGRIDELTAHVETPTAEASTIRMLPASFRAMLTSQRLS